MKILGHHKIKRRTKKVEIGSTPEGLALCVEMHAPRLNAVLDYEKRLAPPPAPTPPSNGEVQRDGRGQVVKDELGRPIVGTNPNDPAYLEALKKHEGVVEDHYRAKTMALLMECLGDQVTIDSKRESFESDVAYYLAAWDEFDEIGLDMTAIHRLSDAALILSGVVEEEVKDAKAALVGEDEGN